MSLEAWKHIQKHVFLPLLIKAILQMWQCKGGAGDKTKPQLFLEGRLDTVVNSFNFGWFKRVSHC